MVTQDTRTPRRISPMGRECSKVRREILAGATVKSTSLFDGSLRLDAADMTRKDEALTEAKSILAKKVVAFNSRVVLRLCRMLLT